MQRYADRWGALDICCEFFGRIVIYDDPRTALSDDNSDQCAVEVSNVNQLARLFRSIFPLSHKTQVAAFQRFAGFCRVVSVLLAMFKLFNP